MDSGEAASRPRAQRKEGLRQSHRLATVKGVSEDVAVLAVMRIVVLWLRLDRMARPGESERERDRGCLATTTRRSP